MDWSPTPTAGGETYNDGNSSNQNSTGDKNTGDKGDGDGDDNEDPIDPSTFVSVWRTTEANETIELPLREGFAYDMTVDWGDGSTSQIDSWDHPDKVHMYAEPGDYTVTISGLAQAWYFIGDFTFESDNTLIDDYTNDGGNEDKIILVKNFADLGWINLEYAFRGCENLTTYKGGNVSQVSDLSRMFNAAEKAKPDVSSWNTSNVTNMSDMFSGAKNANPDVSNWNTSSVTNMRQMFSGAKNANPDVSNWDTSNVTNMGRMFSNTNQANPDVSNWNTSNVTDMAWMFGYTDQANPNLAGWDFSSIDDMENMFVNSAAFTDESYTNLLISLQQTATQSDVQLDAPDNQYMSTAVSARNYLINTLNWTINDDGQVDQIDPNDDTSGPN